MFVVDDGKHRLGILTDLGHVFTGLADVIASLDAVLLESNYDPDMLANGSRPEWLKERIAGPGGHISNFEAAELLLASASKRMKWACLGHLSAGHQHAGAGPGNASQDSGRPAAVVRGDSVRGERGDGSLSGFLCQLHPIVADGMKLKDPMPLTSLPLSRVEVPVRHPIGIAIVVRPRFAGLPM